MCTSTQRSESGLRLFLTPLLDPSDRQATYERDLAHVEQELAALGEVQAGMQRAPEPEVFAPQVELGIRMNNVLRDWLREQIKASATEGGQRKGPHQ